MLAPVEYTLIANTLSFDNTNNLVVYPNPTANKINLTSLQDLSNAQVSIVDASGNEVVNFSNINSNGMDVFLF